MESPFGCITTAPVLVHVVLLRDIYAELKVSLLLDSVRIQIWFTHTTLIIWWLFKWEMY